MSSESSEPTLSGDDRPFDPTVLPSLITDPVVLATPARSLTPREAYSLFAPQNLENRRISRSRRSQSPSMSPTPTHIKVSECPAEPITIGQPAVASRGFLPTLQQINSQGGPNTSARRESSEEEGSRASLSSIATVGSSLRGRTQRRGMKSFAKTFAICLLAPVVLGGIVAAVLYFAAPLALGAVVAAIVGLGAWLICPAVTYTWLSLLLSHAVYQRTVQDLPRQTIDGSELW